MRIAEWQGRGIGRVRSDVEEKWRNRDYWKVKKRRRKRWRRRERERQAKESKLVPL